MNENEKPPQGESSDEPQLFALTRDATGYRLDRRSFLKAASMAAAAAMPTPGCATKGAAKNKAQRPQGNKMLVVDERNIDLLPRAHKGKVSLALSADGRLLASAGADQTIKLWALPEGRLTSALPSPGDAITVFLSSDGKLLASGGGTGKSRTTRFWPLPKGKKLEDVKSFAVAMSADGKLLTGMNENSIELWSLPEGKKLAVLSGVDSEFSNSVSLSADGKMLACVGNPDKNVIKLWAAPTGEEFKTLIGHNDPVRVVSICPDGNLLASGEGTTIRLWSLPEGTELTKIKEHGTATTALAFSGNGRLLASGHSDKSVRLWEMPTGKQLATFENHEDPVNSVALTIDAKFLLVGTSGGRIFLRELEGEKRCWILFDPDLEQDQVKASGYDEREKMLAGTVCTCNLVCTCNTIWVPGGKPLPYDATCVCNTIMLGKLSKVAGAGKNVKSTRTVVGTICTCDLVCTCNTISLPSKQRPSNPGGGTYRGGGHYWRPN